MPTGIYIRTDFHRKQISKGLEGTKRKKWKDLSLGQKHQRINKKLGKPKICQHCGTTTAKTYEWANKNHLYSENETDWIRLCSKCHKKMDWHTPDFCKCGNKHFAKGLCRKCWSKQYNNKYYNNPKNKQKQKEYKQIYYRNSLLAKQ